jgi:membrane protein DedA with SNARE-associated domain
MSLSDRWFRALGKSLVIFAYFVFATVWFPSWILGVTAVAAAPAVIHDLVGATAWLVPFVSGLWILRRLQAAGRI